MVAQRDNFPLIAELLAEQQQLDTPVARYAAAHDAGSIPSVALRHSSPIPLSKPGPGEQYAFEVELDSCTGCKACVSACHSLNGLDETEMWRDVGLVVGGSVAKPYQQTVTTACHHCADPACLNGCPVLAYEKDPVTGIVRHLDDQCIGCQYCVLKCPYDVPKYNGRLGIVRKCDMCHSRLAEGEAPACVQACPTHAIRIVTVSISEDRAGASLGRGIPGGDAPPRNATSFDTSSFLSAAPDPAYTQPTTRYLSRRPQPENTRAADAGALRPQPPHWPLAVMLTLMPAAVGLFAAATLLSLAPRPLVTYYVTSSPEAVADARHVIYYMTCSGWLAGVAGLAASTFHLGQPWRAWRIFLGWRRSWLSREAMAFGAWSALATAALFWTDIIPLAAAAGACGLACSVMIYVDTRREFWRLGQTASRLLGGACVVALAGFAPSAAALLVLFKLVWESRPFFARGATAKLLRGPLRHAAAARDGLGLAAAMLMVARPGPVALAVWMAGELADRHLFFRAVDAPKMPGVPA